MAVTTRTTAVKVKTILGRQYDATAALDLTAFIETAALTVDEVVSCMSTRDITAFSSDHLEMLERWLAAHYYAHEDQLFSDKKTLDASAKFQGTTGMGFESTQYGQAALGLDSSGCLASLNQGRRKGTAVWLGLPPSEQTDYVDRD